ncbi:flagellar protein FlaG [Bacillus ndiopicus]|uniref:flagellar protein FlaG n=1 Tax=Bacillus ndiopicus TaxID=1347368 RepID=UPI0005A9872E|nr:flagellar protein FlaG [Bacillus ndiopicus]
MRITGNADTSAVALNKSIASSTPKVEDVAKQGSEATMHKNVLNIEQVQQPSTDEEIKVKVQEAVETMNKMLEIHNNAAKFMYHDGLDRYYITVVDRDTEEVIKEIPPKKLLDAFYEMQKLFGMIVDKRI